MSTSRQTLNMASAPLPATVDAVAFRLDKHKALLDELLDWGVHLRVTRSVAVRTCARYLVAVADFGLWLARGQRSLADIDRDLIDDWMEYLYLERRLAATSRQVMLIAVRSFLDWRVLEHGGENPARQVRGPRKKKTEPRKLSPKQVQKLVQACDPSRIGGLRDLCMLVFMLSTGARPGEMAMLRLDQLDMREQVGRVRFEGKGAKERTVSFEGPAIKLLVDWLQARDQLDLLEPQRVWTTLSKNDTGRPLSQRGLERTLQRMGKRARVGFSARHLRVTFATELYESRSDIEEIRKLLGHESIETTRRYLSVSDRMQKARIPSRHMRRLIGDQSGIPMWAEQKLGEANDRTD